MNDVATPDVKFGIFDHLDDSGIGHAQQYGDRLLLAEACDRAGFLAYHVAEHHGTRHGIAPSPNLFLASMAQRTTRIRLGPLVMILNLYHPLRAFEEICMLDQLSGGRAELGIGRGVSPVELGFFGICPTEAQDRYREALDIIRAAMAGGTVTYHGRHFALSDVSITIAPFQRPHPPLWLGVSNPEGAEWAAENGANIACYGETSAIRRLTDTFRRSFTGCGKSGAKMPLLGMMRTIVIDDSERDALALAEPAYERWFETLVELPRRHGIATRISVPANLRDAIERGTCLVGTASTVRDTLLRQVREGGSNYLLCHISMGNLPLEASLRSVEAIRSEIMPCFAGRPAT
jgi:alkanesulfonate monooxygenase SsuD/methylene tetrahydromethanopterin reductase-like flavin-dependent oxidoreductase (luciferase family)